MKPRPLGNALMGLALLICGFGLAPSATAQPEFPSLTGRVVDQAGVLRSATERAIADQLEAHEASTSNQLVVVTLSSLQGYSIEDFGVQLGRHWGIGQAGRDNGALLIVAPRERKVRIEVGYGLEGALTDALARTIIESEILPAFRRDNLERGVRAGTDAILAAIAGTYEPPAQSSGPPAFAPMFLIVLVVGGIFLFVVFLIIRDAFRDGGGSSPRTSRDNSDTDWYSSGGGYGGGSGGFSGGGGGFGGGGSSGSW